MNQLLAMRVFVRAVEAAGFGRAADQLNMPRSTVSKLVADLEIHLGTRLIQRTTRTAGLTPEGAAYYERVAPLVAQIEDADMEIRGQHMRPHGRLRIEVTSSFANLMLIPALADFRQRYPDLHVDIGINDRTVDIVGDGIDCALRVGELDDTSLMARKLFDADVIACAAPAYLAARGIPATPAELRERHDIIGYFSAASGRPRPLVFIKNGRRELIDGFCLSANESTGHIALMLAGLGIGQNIREVMAPHLASGALVAILPDWQQPTVPYHLLFPASRHRSSRFRVFLDWMVERFGTAIPAP